MKKKVFAVITNWTYDWDPGFAVEIFATYQAAKEYFDKIVAEKKLNDHLMESEDVQMTETENYFATWEDGRWCEDHFETTIEGKLIKD